MEKQISEKLDALAKYIPFIDFILEIDKEKYVKFIDIKRWIENKKRYPLKDLNKIEQSIITQYKNMIVLDDRKIKPEIMHIFRDEFQPQFVDLCSDDEDNNPKATNQNSSTNGQVHEAVVELNNDSDDDDLEIVSVTYVKKEKTKEIEQQALDKSEENAINECLDEFSAELLEEIDQLCKIEVKSPKRQENGDSVEDLFERRTPPVLFKRRDDLVNTKAERLDDTINADQNRTNLVETSTISLDSSDDEESSHSKMNHNKDTEKVPIPVPAANEVEDCKTLFTRLSEVKQSKNNDTSNSANSSVSKGDNTSSSESQTTSNKIENSPNHQISVEKTAKDVKCLSSIGDIDLSSLDNLDMEELLTCIIRIGDQKNADLESLLCKTVLRRVRSSTVEGQLPQQIPGEERNNVFNNTQCGNQMALQSMTTLPLHELGVRQHPQQHLAYFNPQHMPSVYPSQPGGGYHQPQIPQNTAETAFKPNPQRKLNLHDPRIRQFLNRFKNSPLLSPLEREMAANLIQNPIPPTPQFIVNRGQPPYIPPPQFAHNQIATASHIPPPFQTPQVAGQNIIMTSIPHTQIRENNFGGPHAISYAEYKRRQDKERWEKQREEEQRRRQEEERLRREEAQKQLEEEKRRKQMFDEIAKRDSQRTTDEIRSILLDTLQPLEGKIATLWDSHKTLMDGKLTEPQTTPSNCQAAGIEGNICKSGPKINKETPNKRSSDSSEASGIECKNRCKARKGNEGAAMSHLEKEKPYKNHEAPSTPSKTNVTGPTTAEKTKIDRTSRIFKELECTFKGFDHFQDSIPRAIGGRRRSSIHARSAIAEQLNSCEDSEICSPSPNRRKSRRKTVDLSPQSLEERKRRRSSLHARTAIAKQLNGNQAKDEDSNNHNLLPKRRKTTDDKITGSSEEGKHRGTKSHNNNTEGDACISLSESEDDMPIRPSSSSSRIRRNYIIDDDDDVPKVLPMKRISRFLKQPRIILKRLTENEIKMHTNPTEDSVPLGNILNVRLVASKSQTAAVETATSAAATKKSSLTKKALPKRLNNDCEMTEGNTTFCVLCSSKPSDLTHHYIRKHKTESYVSRLSWSQLDELCINTPFAKEVASISTNSSRTTNGVTRYAVKCPFCNDELVQPFMNLYNHYTTHTGEYAYQCSGCQLDKPFRADIQSHQLHSKNCRGSNIQILYRYPSNSMVIYLHYCDICNFVQLNEANIRKHLREHHDQRQSNPNNVKKCILVAISDGPDQPVSSPPSPPPLTNENMVVVKTIHPPSTQTQDNQPIAPDVATNTLNLNINIDDDDDITVRNEAGNEEELLETAMCPFDKKLKQMHEDPKTISKSATPMTEICPLDKQLQKIHEEPKTIGKSTPSITVIHSQPVTEIVASVMISDGFAMTHIPKILKNDQIDTESGRSVTPPMPSLEKLTKNLNLYRSSYRLYPMNVKYLGLYKCMSDDCYYSTDCANDFLRHLEDHSCDNPVGGAHLQCPYCSIFEGNNSISSPQQVIDHIRMQHLHMSYQCSACCYRSCEASNVVEHQRENHTDNYGACKVFKCPGEEREHGEEYIKEKVAENVQKIQCQFCKFKLFYHSNLLEHHITSEHNVQLVQPLKYYSCIYCPLTNSDETSVRRHLALKHPEEMPIICNHNNVVAINEDLVHNLSTLFSTQPVTFVDVKEIGDQPTVSDMKPGAEELLKCQEETVRIRLRKLTEKTGVAPDSLYRCPEPTCGGFFSIYDLWLRHMQAKHHCMECWCPHCHPTSKTTTPPPRSLTEYKTHFEEHRRHTYICFHCSATFRNSQDSAEHASRDHAALGTVRSEQIRFNLSYSYFVQIQSEMLTTRTEFLPALMNVLDKRLKEKETNESKSLKNSWLVPRHNASLSSWLEEYPVDSCRPLRKKCFNGNCDFRATEAEVLFQHLREKHNIKGSTFNCSQCDFYLENCQQWDEVLSHIQQHSDSSFFICGACYSHHSYRSKLAQHIREEHAARDVPIINLIRKRGKTYLRLAVAFANECISFSTIRNCFCCEERGMKGDAFISHLKRYHKFGLNYYCEWCNSPIESLQLAEEHYRKVHTVNKLKIRCELTSKYNVHVVSVRNFQVHIDSSGRATTTTAAKAVAADEQSNVHQAQAPPTNEIRG